MARRLGSATMANEDTTPDIYPKVHMLVKSYDESQVSKRTNLPETLVVLTVAREPGRPRRPHEPFPNQG